MDGMLPHFYRAKRLSLLIAAATYSLCNLYAQSPGVGRCTASAVPTTVRAEGLTERVGDIVLQCTGLTPASSFSSNLTLFLPVSVTNRVDSSNRTQDVT